MVYVHLLAPVRVPAVWLTLVLTSISIVALRKNVAFIALFAFLTATFAVLAAGEFSANLK